MEYETQTVPKNQAKDLVEKYRKRNIKIDVHYTTDTALIIIHQTHIPARYTNHLYRRLN
ncbi:hypothetical protein [Enterovibrio sp. 27052020O]|uniref:hypothetical protein n=1 Tax=Enterovibrio sp. 27052020O TaxID=3241166 RepID=UPI00388E1FD3